jgi:hypothetical protein
VLEHRVEALLAHPIGLQFRGVKEQRDLLGLAEVGNDPAPTLPDASDAITRAREGCPIRPVSLRRGRAAPPLPGLAAAPTRARADPSPPEPAAVLRAALARLPRDPAPKSQPPALVASLLGRFGPPRGNRDTAATFQANTRQYLQQLVRVGQTMQKILCAVSSM